MIIRERQLELLMGLRHKQLIKVAVGVRRCGKSMLFKLYQEALLADGVKKEQIIDINLEDMKYEALSEYHALYSYIDERLYAGGYTYIFIDEVQNCPHFEKAIDSLFIKDNVDIYLTGSNAYMLSGELATLLSGRYVTVELLPFSFAEYSQVYPEASSVELFARYLADGGFPYAATSITDAKELGLYLDGIYNTVLIKDVAQREGITDIPLLQRIVRTMASAVGSPVSTKKITDTIVSSGRKISQSTVERYVQALSDAFVFYKVDRYDIKGRENLKTLGKYYMVDTGLRGHLAASSSEDTGHMLENIVYLELRRRGYNVFVGKIGDAEVDFVAEREGELTYYQVSATVLEEEVLKRELRPLQRINDHYPKMLLTLDTIGDGRSYDGIRQRNLVDWLLEFCEKRLF